MSDEAVWTLDITVDVFGEELPLLSELSRPVFDGAAVALISDLVSNDDAELDSDSGLSRVPSSSDFII